MERKIFYAKPKHQYRESTRGKCVCEAQSQKNNGDYYENPYLSFLMAKL